MVNWILILIVLAAFFVISRYIHFRNLKHKVMIIGLIVLVLFLYVSFTGIAKTNSLDIKTLKGFSETGKLYLSWLKLGFDNVKTITTSAIKMDWFPSINSTEG